MALRNAAVLTLLAAAAMPAAAQEQGFSTEGKFERDAVETAAPPSRPFDVLDYTLRLRLAMTDAALEGAMKILLVMAEPADSIRLNAAALSIDTVRVGGSLTAVTEYPGLESFSVPLGGPRAAGDTVTVEIRYRRVPEISRPSSRQGYYFYTTAVGIPANLGYTMAEPSDARFWMPCYDEPWEKATASISITVPEPYVAASNGALLGTESPGDGTITWHWTETNQIATYLMAVTASRFTISTLPFERSVNDTVPLQYVVWAEDSAGCAAYLPTVHEMMVALSELFGPYPFDKYGMTAVTPFQFGGMEHQTITTMHRAYRTDERVVVHELAHQWWGNLVTCGTWKDIWLNESFASYSEALWAEWRDGPQGLKDEMARMLTPQYGSWTGSLYDPVGQGFNLFANSVYSKGAWVLHTLRGVLGDSAFFAVLDAYRDRHRQGNAVTEDFRAVVDSVGGESYGWFFDQWVYGSGWPEYAVGHRTVADTLELTVYQVQSAAWPTYTMPVRLRMTGPGGDTTVVVWNSARTETFRIVLPFTATDVEFDPDGWILKTMGEAPLSADETGQVPAGIRLHQNYPNPFNPTTRIRYELPAPHRVTLAVYDLLGREVARLVEEERAGGSHAVEFDGADLAGGLYLYRLRAVPVDGTAATARTASRKMVLVK